MLRPLKWRYLCLFIAAVFIFCSSYASHHAFDEGLGVASGAPALNHGSQQSEGIVIVAGGDILLDRGVRSAPGFSGDGHRLFDGIRPIISAADLAFANLECPLTTQCYSLPKRSCFRGDPDKARVLKRTGFDLLTLANNHVYDCGRDGILSTIEALRSNGIVPVGAGADFREAMRPTVFNIKGLRIAVLGFTEFPLEGLLWDPDRPTPAISNAEEMAAAMKAAKKEADLVIVTMHWGREYSGFQSDLQEETAQALSDAGADFIIGHHPHVLQPCKKIGNTWVAFSLGNLVFDLRTPETKLTALMRIILSPGSRKVRIEFVPFEIEHCRPLPASAYAAQKIARRLDQEDGQVRWKYSEKLIIQAE